MSETLEPIEYFTGEFAFLSNFHSSAIRFEGRVYPTVEHAFQAMKTADEAERATIAAARSPSVAKRLGRKVKLRRDWESVKVGIMREAVRAKFTQHDDLRDALLATGERELIEGNSWNDRLWGVCGGAGQNWLGRILMEIRAELSADSGNQPA